MGSTMAESTSRVCGSPLAALDGCEPLDFATAEGGQLASQVERRLIWAFLLLGIAARTVRYLLRFPLWEDEAFVGANLLGRGYLGLTEPLDYHQVCPFLFLWIELAVVKLLGFTEYTLRLFPYLCSLASLLVFRHLAAQVCRGTALVLAVAVFSVAYPEIRYAAELKPYGSDVLVSLLLLTFAVRWWRRPEDTRWLWGLVLLAPPAVALSYPAVFVGGGISLVAAAVLWRTRCRRAWLPWGLYNLALAGTFAATLLLAARGQGPAVLDVMRDCWQGAFPPLDAPLELLRWLVAVHASDMLAHPFGGPNYGSTLTLVCCAAAVVALWRRRRFMLLLLCASPAALNLVAAAMRRYPYGGSVRVALYLAPVICLLAGLGLAAILSWATSRRSYSPAPVFVALAILGLVGLGSIGRDAWRPAKSDDDLETRDFARWFWSEMLRGGEVVCLEADPKHRFTSDDDPSRTSASYLCNRRIYSPAYARREPPRVDRVSEAWPLRCVRFRSPLLTYDEGAFAEWMHSMTTCYRLVAEDRYPVKQYYDGKRLDHIDYVDVYTFVPKATLTPGERSAALAIGETRR